MVLFKGSGGMNLVARFQVEAYLSPFQAQINEAVKNALVRFGVLRETENGNFESTMKKHVAKGEKTRSLEEKRWQTMTEDMESKHQHALHKMNLSKSMALRMAYSDIMNLMSTIGQATGMGKNQIYQMFTMTISAITGLIMAAQAAITVYATFPQPWGAILAGLTATASASAVATNVLIGISQAQVANWVPETMGNIGEGFDS